MTGGAGSVDPVHLAAATFLKLDVGFTSTAEIARVLDVAMNPNSLFLPPASSSRNALVRALWGRLPF